jgi:hypothetical protein
MTTNRIPRKVAFCQGGCSAMIFATTRPTVTCLRCANEKRRIAARKPPSQKVTTCHAGCGKKLSYTRSAKITCDTCKPYRKLKKDRKAAAVQREKRGGPSDSVRSYHRVWSKDRRKSDPAFVIRARVTALINYSLKSGKQGRSWTSMVPYSLADLMHHLERQFTKGMTWENRAAWHIDHITPLSSFDITGPDCPEFKAAWCLSNLRPLWAIDNIRKSATRTHLI